MDELRFACDAMLGTLARWLRFAGFDTLFDPRRPDAELAAAARDEGRWLLTRDRRLASAAGPRVVLLHAAGLAEEVAELRRRLPLRGDPRRFFARCSCCNGLLEEAPAEAVRDRVPPFVAVSASHFRRCPECGRLYWSGTHTSRIARRLAELFADEEDSARDATQR